jgi:hypothetical protein
MGGKASKQSLAGRDGAGSMRGRMSWDKNPSNNGAESTTDGKAGAQESFSNSAGRLAEGDAAVADASVDLAAVEVAALVDMLGDAIPKKYSPPDCKCCKELRANDPKSYTEVYSTHRSSLYITRYIRCRFCGATSKDMEKVS